MSISGEGAWLDDALTSADGERVFRRFFGRKAQIFNDVTPAQAVREMLCGFRGKGTYAQDDVFIGKICEEILRRDEAGESLEILAEPFFGDPSGLVEAARDTLWDAQEKAQHRARWVIPAQFLNSRNEICVKLGRRGSDARKN